MLFKESLTTFKNKTKRSAFGATYDSNYGLYAAFSMYIIDWCNVASKRGSYPQI
jgi:hypothetical protein